MCEDTCRLLETLVPNLLRSVATQWPPSEEDRILLARFVALHILRTPEFVRWFEAARETSLERMRGKIPDPTRFDQFVRPAASRP